MIGILYFQLSTTASSDFASIALSVFTGWAKYEYNRLTQLLHK